MAVTRQQQFLGQQRIDVPHLRAIESGVAHDFDVLGGVIMAGKVAAVVTGFRLLETGAIGADASALVLQVAGGALVHYLASESGSVFRVPEDRANETLGPTNAKVTGSFTPNATNFIGLDLKRSADDTTADTVQFLNTTTNKEQPKVVPLARTLDYRIVVSTTEFSATPGLAPLAKVVTDASNKVVSMTDCRHMLFRLGSGGSNPNSVSPYGWPGGRNEASAATVTVAGDRSIDSLKAWLNAAMTRMWELGGGEYWYSATADRNVRMIQTAVFSSTGESFEWSGTDIHWKGLKFIFDNSTAGVNEVQEQLTDSAGLTDLADGECIYVDLDRTVDRKVSTTNPVVAQKGVLKTLGMSSTPGQRYVICWRNGSNVFVRDQSYSVGSSFLLATVGATGTIRTSIDPDGGWSESDPVAAGIAMDAAAGFAATAGGLSHNLDTGTAWTLAGGDLVIGRGTAAGDENILLETDDDLYATVVKGTSDYAANGRAALEVEQADQTSSDPSYNATLELRGWDGSTTKVGHTFEVGGVIGFRNAPVAPAPPAPTATKPIRWKLFSTTNGLASPLTQDVVCIIWHDGSITEIARSPAY